MFNKKFEKDYPNVRKPIVCNGLKEIVPFKNKKEIIEEKEIEIKIEPEPEPEPEISP